MRRVAVVALTWMSSLALAAVYLVIGSSVDQLVTGSALTAFPWGAAGALVAGVSAWAASRLGSDALGGTEVSLRHRVLDQVFDLGASERTRERAGRIVSTATDGVERAAGYRATFIAPMIASLATPALVLVVVAIAIDPLSAGLLAISIPLVPLCIGAFQMAFRSVSARYRTSSRALAAQELDAIQGLSTLALLNAGRAMGQRLTRASEDLRRSVMRLLAGNQLVLLVVDAVFSLAMVTAAVVLAAWRVRLGAITPGQGIALVLMSSLMLDPLDRIGQFFYIGMGGIAAGKEIRAFCEETPGVVDAPGVRWPADGPGPADRDTVGGAGGTGAEVAPASGAAERGAGERGAGDSVRLEDVHFSYDGTTPVLDGVDLDLAAGDHLVLTGPSGAGKTTIAALVQADLRPDNGRVLVGGHDLREVPLEWTRSQVAVVAQHTYLFTGTLRDNLLLADPAADDERLLDALRRAHLGDLLDRLPAGLDTPVGERGLGLSGGEAQRVAIARALLKDAPVLVLDEPTAHVDLTSEREILQALQVAARGRTTLTISHRAATIEDATIRAELRDGHVTRTVARTGAGAETGAGAGMGTSNATGAETGAGASAEIGAGTGAETGAGVSAGTGAGAGAAPTPGTSIEEDR